MSNTFFSLFTQAQRRCQLSQSMLQKGMDFYSDLPFHPFPCTIESQLLLLSAAFWKFCLMLVSVKAAVMPLVCRAGESAASLGGSTGVGVVAGGYQGPGRPRSAFLCAVAPSHKAHEQRQRRQM